MVGVFVGDENGFHAGDVAIRHFQTVAQHFVAAADINEKACPAAFYICAVSFAGAAHRYYSHISSLLRGSREYRISARR